LPIVQHGYPGQSCSPAVAFPHSDDTGALEHGALELLCRALHIGRSIGWDKPEIARARAAVVRVRERAMERSAGVAALWFAELDLDFGVSDPAAVAVEIEGVLAAPANADVHILSSLWRLSSDSQVGTQA
jgi:hypothetical protein